MEVYLKKYFWLVPVIVVIICSVFTAKAVNHYVEGKYLGDAEVAPKTKASATPTKRPKIRSKSGDPLIARNMFCSECVPEVPEDDGVIVDSDHPPETSLPLRLVATNVSTIDEYSFATILNTSSERQGAYSMTSAIPDGGKIVRISAKYVDFENESSKRVERISLLSDSKPKRTVAKTPTRPRSRRRGPKNELMAMIDEGVEKVDDENYVIDRDVVDKVLENPAAVARGARIVPSIKNGKANGFKLYAIRPSSVYAKIGLMNGDTIHSINGFELNSPDKALEVYMKLREANSLSVEATRRGKPVKLNYNIK